MLTAEEPDRDLPADVLLEQQAHVDRAAARAAIRFRDADAEPPQLRDSLVELRVVRLAAVVGERVALLMGAAFAPGEVADRVDERTLLVGEGLDAHVLSFGCGGDLIWYE